MAPGSQGPDEFLTLSEVAERVVELGLAPSMSRQRVKRLAETDPEWPVPEAEWRRIGRYWQIPWDERLSTYFAKRDRGPGPKGWNTMGGNASA